MGGRRRAGADFSARCGGPGFRHPMRMSRPPRELPTIGETLPGGRIAAWGQAGWLLAATALLVGCAQPPQRAFGPPPPERVRSIAAGDDAERLARARTRSAVLRVGASATRLYHLAKAEAWLDFAADAGQRDAGGDAAEDALDQALGLLGALERGRSPSLHTLHVVASRPVRPDLWREADAVRNSSGFPCAAEPLAHAEVALVRAGHHAYLGDAAAVEEAGARVERLLAGARNEALSCVAATGSEPDSPRLPRWAPVAAGSPTAPEPVRASSNLSPPQPDAGGTARAGANKVDVVRLPTDTLFSFAAASLDAARSATLRELAQRIRATPTLVAVRIDGHTDRLSRSGPNYNRSLSASRARAVGKALAAHGVDPRLIEARGHGDGMPVVVCPGRRTRAVIDCLAPNRRVVIEIEYGE